MFFVRFCVKNYLTLNKPREARARAIVLLRGKILHICLRICIFCSNFAGRFRTDEKKMGICRSLKHKVQLQNILVL